MRTWFIVLYVAAAVCFALAVLGVTVHPRLNLIAAELLAWVLVPLIALASA